LSTSIAARIASHSVTLGVGRRLPKVHGRKLRNLTVVAILG
jgi:hypothetical protein